MSADPAPIRHAPLALWRVAEAFLHVLYNLFGAPEDVAFRHTLTLEPYRLLASWLRVGEALLRRLIVIEAAAYPKPNTRPILWPKRKRTRRARGFEPDKPGDWRVSFRCFSSAIHAGRVSARGAMGAAPRQRIAREERWSYENFRPQSFHSAWPLAERYEALIRVFNNPVGYARRLAKRLFAAPHRVRETLREPPEARHRIDRYHALEHATDRAAAAFLNTS